ncbi:hypothetical protein E2I21_00770 [Alcaligenaceae bacterium SAGV5]|nr:hypothetical protein [Alcaligenaceae bacterium SAGV5]
MFKAIRFIALGLAVQGPVFAAAESYPAGPVTIVVPYAAGGLADNIARPIADALGRELKQPFIVENKGGAGGPRHPGQDLHRWSRRSAGFSAVGLLFLNGIKNFRRP